MRAVVDLCGEEGLSEIELCMVLGRDPGMSLWMMCQANSGMFCKCQSVSTIEEAVACIGARAAKIVSLSMVPASGGFVAGGVRGMVAEVWARALLRERVAREIAELMGERGVWPEARMATYGVDCALLAMSVADPERANGVWQEEQGGGGCGSMEGLSAGLMDRWGVGEMVCEAVRAGDSMEESDQGFGVVGRIVRGAEVVVRHTMRRGAWRCSERAGSRLEQITGLDRGVLGGLIRGSGAAYEQDLRAWLGSEEDAVRASAVETLARLSIAIHAEHHKVVHQRDELLHRVTLDRLTGVFNRGAFDDRLLEEMERARRGGEPLALLMCDLDEFKQVNDRHGHQAGDHVLKRVADEIVEAARRIDVVARYGGEEFMVIAPRCDYSGAAFLAERLRAAVAGMELAWRGASLWTTMSIGGAVCTWPGAVLQPEQLIAAADRRLYDAKRHGRNCVRIEGPDRVRAWAG